MKTPEQDLDKIIQAIEKKDLKKKKIAKKIGITVVYFSYILNRKTPLTENVRDKLFDYLEIPMF